MSPFIDRPTLYDNQKRIYFTSIENDELRYVIKHYAYYKIGQVSPMTVKERLRSLHHFIDFCKEEYITDFSEVNFTVFSNFLDWLKNKYDKQQIVASTAYDSSFSVEEIITQGLIENWFPSSGVRVKGLSHKRWGKLAKVERETNKRTPIPEAILDQILFAAKHKEPDLITKSAIIIQSQTGLRISEVLGLKVGCVKKSEDAFYMDVLIPKSDDGENVIHHIFINDWVVQTVQELETITMHLRTDLKQQLKSKIEAIKRKNTSTEEQLLAITKLERDDISGCLFLYRYTLIQNGYSKIVVPKVADWNHRFLHPFMERWNIVDEFGKPYNITSHRFRHTFVCSLIKKKVPLSFISSQLSHLSIEITDYYHSLDEESTKKELAKKIIHPTSKIAGKRSEEIRQQTVNLFKGKTATEIDNIVSELAETLNFNPLPTGVCLYDEIRGRCTDGDGCFFYNCPNYVTNTDFYPLLKRELDMLEATLSRHKLSGRKRDYDRVYIKWEHLKPLVEELEAQQDGTQKQALV